jgi:hypothetical protein
MHEHILARGALDESVSFRPVEPLHSTLLSHKETPFPSSLRIILPSLVNLPDRGSPQDGARIFWLALPCAGDTAPTETAPLHLVEQLPATKCGEAAKTKARFTTANTETSILLRTR